MTTIDLKLMMGEFGLTLVVCRGGRDQCVLQVRMPAAKILLMCLNRIFADTTAFTGERPRPIKPPWAFKGHHASTARRIAQG